MKRWSVKAVVPGLSVALTTLLSALPWGLPPQTRFLLPLLPFAAIHFWAMRRPGLMPEWLAFLTGLATDVLTHGPLGFWSLVFLLGLWLAQVTPPDGRWSGAGRWLHFASSVLLLAAAQWLIATMYFLSAADWAPFLGGAAAVAGLYPLMALLLAPLDRLWPQPDNVRFERGV